MADPSQVQGKEGQFFANQRGSRSPSPVLIYPPQQQASENAASKSTFVQSPTLLREPQRSPSALPPLPQITPLTIGTSETNLEAVSLLREPLRSSSAKTSSETAPSSSAIVPALPSPDISQINSDVQSLFITDATTSQSETETQSTQHLPVSAPPPLPSTKQSFVVRADSPPPPPVPPLPTSYLTNSSPESLPVSLNEFPPENGTTALSQGRFLSFIFINPINKNN